MYTTYPIQSFVGQTLLEISAKGFKTDTGSFSFEHHQDCCESVYPVGLYFGGSDENIPETTGNPIITVAYLSNDEPDSEIDREYSESHTWSRFFFVTAAGTYEVRWLGESNGYYGEDVDIIGI